MPTSNVYGTPEPRKCPASLIGSEINNFLGEEYGVESRLAFMGSIGHVKNSFKIMTLKLSTLAVILGLGLGLPQIYGLLKPADFRAAVRKFPRSLPWGYALMLLGTVWFLLNLSQESISDFAAYKNVLLGGFAAVGIASCIYVQDFLAARGLAVVLLLLAKLMLDTGRPHLGETNFVLLIQVWAYVLVVMGIWLTISPWRLRDWLEWATVNESRTKTGCVIRLAVGLVVAALGWMKF